MLEHKSVSFKADDGENTGRLITGYGAVFGNEDSVGDVILPGAFAKSLASGRKVKMLYQHWADDICGVWDEVKEDETGLRVSGRVAETTLGNDVAALLKMGALDSLSIGYRTTDSEWKGETRVIKEADLWEISIVTFPANASALIDAVKAADMSKRDMERKLRDAGFSRAAAQKLLSGGFDALSDQRDADEAKGEILALLNKQADLLKSR